MKPIACVSGATLETLRQRFGAEEAAAAGVTHDAGAIVFADRAALDTLDSTFPGLIIGVCADPAEALRWIETYPWVAHVVSESTFESEWSSKFLDRVISSFESRKRLHIFEELSEELVGRKQPLTRFSQCEEGIARMATYLTEHDIGAAEVELLARFASELLATSFYQGPLLAGAVSRPLARDADVELPPDSPCELAYGCTESLAVLRVRDPFGVLPRTHVARVSSHFAEASLVSVSVASHHHTDVLVALPRQRGERLPFGFHVFYKENRTSRFWRRSSRDNEHSFAATITTTETVL
ncbi:MAG TPA: hypothetical protein VGC41_20170 [Kofleriaceae bacterium]